MEIKHLFGSSRDRGRQFCFYKLCDEDGVGVRPVNCHRLFSHKDNTVGSATDLPPFNGLMILNDGQIKIEGLNIATQDSSALLTATSLRWDVAQGQKPS